ncbi:MAG: putative helicase [Bacteroidetes bacterium]|nr:putative helicase [Bacteroidota bacterium]
MNNLIVYKASAGSGKTFALVVEYVYLLVDKDIVENRRIITKTGFRVGNSFNYRNILAVTFTNKATAEMKDRLLSLLYGLSRGLDYCKGEMERIISLSLERGDNFSQETVRLSADTALSNILHDFSYFNIETIDSFFQRVLRNMSRELGIGSSYNLLIEDTEVVAQAVDRIIESTSEDKALKAWYMDMIFKNIEEGRRWNIEESLKSFAKHLSKEKFKEFEGRLTKSLELTALESYRRDVFSKMESILVKITSFGYEFESILIKNSLTVDSFSYGKSGVAGAILKLKSGDISLSGKRVYDALNEDTKWFPKNKTSFFHNALAREYFIPLLSRATTYCEQNERIFNTCKIALSQIDSLGLLVEIAKHRREILREENAFLLSDTATLLASMVSSENGSDISFIFEKIGSNLRYIMIDEFQDTSKVNWKNFQLLLSESYDNQNRSIIVGDVKQSIYRWNNGDWSLLAGIEKGITPSQRLNPRTPRVVNLTHNYRTCEEIISFNNSLFSSISMFLNSPRALEKLCDESRAEIVEVFSDSVQIPIKRKETGEVRIRLLEAKSRSEGSPILLEALVKEIEYYQDKGFAASDITVILRFNKEIRQVATYLAEHRKANPNTKYSFDVVSDEAFYFSSSPSVSLLISALEYIEDKNNTLALTKIKLFSKSSEEVFDEDLTKASSLSKELEWLSDRDKLSRKPLTDLVIYLVQMLGLSERKEDAGFVYAFLDEVQEYSRNHGQSLGNFLRFWTESLCNKSIPSGESLEGIRLISIHKSKGLEFPITILPFASWSFTDTARTELWVESPEGFDEVPLLPVRLSSMQNSLFEEDYEAELKQQVVDNLNLLYVSLTRAKQALSILGNYKENDKGEFCFGRELNVSEFLYHTVGTNYNDFSLDDDNSYFLSLGNATPLEHSQTKSSHNNIFKQDGQREYMELSWQDADIIFAQTKKAEEFVSALISSDNNETQTPNPQLPNRLKGIILHNILSNIECASDADKALERSFIDGEFTSEYKVEFEDIIRKMLEQEEAKSWFDGTYRTLNESSIIHKQDYVVSSRPDRLMIGTDETIILDYKFAQGMESMDKYTKQLGGYAELLRTMNFSNIRGFLWFVSYSEGNFSSKIVEITDI